MIQIGWIFSLARCGSSIAAYAAACPWEVPVADEVFGPWDRTGEPYRYPPAQRELAERFQQTGGHLTPEIVEIAQRLIESLAAGHDRLIIKMPHLMVRPWELATAFPQHRAVHLLRNPLWRLNSLYARGWLDAIGPRYDIERFAVAAERWRRAPHRLNFKDLLAHPEAFFRRLWTMWGWSFTEADVQRAVTYQSERYHDNSRVAIDRVTPDLRSAEAWCVPRRAFRAYMRDARIRGFLRTTRAPTSRRAYVNATRHGARRFQALKTAHSRAVRIRLLLRAQSVADVWADHGCVLRPRLLAFAIEDCTQMHLCHRAIGASETVGVQVNPAPLLAENALPIGCQVSRGDIRDLPPSVELGSFDIATALAALDGNDRPGDVLQSIAARLRPGGVLIVTSPSPLWRRIAHPLRGGTRVSRDTLSAWCRGAGIDLVSHRRFMQAAVVAGAWLGWIADSEHALALERRFGGLRLPTLNRLFVAVKPPAAGESRCEAGVGPGANTSIESPPPNHRERPDSAHVPHAAQRTPMRSHAGTQPSTTQHLVSSTYWPKQ